MRVLVIDDEPDIRTVAEMSLARVGGHEVLLAGSGEEGIEAARSQRPDAILLDSMMPGLDGPATIERLKADPDTAAIPVVFLTAKLQAVDRERYLQLGAVAVLPKPFDPMGLPDELERALGSEGPA
jgi:two-component system, OmpR family, response regulator